MRYALLAVLVAACGASTELDDFSDGVPPDAGTPRDGSVDAGRPPEPGDLLAAFSGNTLDDGTSWGRPFDCGSTAAGSGYFYTVATFENPLPIDLQVTVEVDWSFDGFLHVYSNFDPRRPGSGCIGANDDFMGTGSSQVTRVVVPAFGQIDLVLSSFGEGSSGRYDAFIIAE